MLKSISALCADANQDLPQLAIFHVLPRPAPAAGREYAVKEALNREAATIDHKRVDLLRAQVLVPQLLLANRRIKGTRTCP